MKINKESFYLRLLFCVYALLIMFGFKTYTIWNQITDVLNENTSVSPIMLLNSFNAHTLRLLLMYPIMKFSEIMNLNADLIFSSVVFLNIKFASNKIINVQKRLSQNKFDSVLIVASMITISLFMNGRTSFSFLGISIMLKSFFDYYQNQINLFKLLFLILISLLLCSVSSGSFSVALMSCLIFMMNLFITAKNYKKDKVKLIILLLIISFPIYNLMEIFVKKNLEFYDNSIIKMLNHGAGKIFMNSGIIILFLLVFPFVLILLLSTLKFYFKDFRVFLFFPFVISGITIGLFGFTSFWTSFPIYTLLMINFFDKMNYSQSFEDSQTI